MFDLSLYSLALIVHVAAASVLLASSIVAPQVRRSMLGAHSLDVLRLWVEFDRRVTKADPSAALVLLATGVYLGSGGWWTQPWFFVATAAWIVNSFLAVQVVQKSSARLQVAIGANEGAVDEGVEPVRRARGWDTAHQIMRANDFAMLYVMFQKPGLLESAVVCGVAIATSVALGRWRARAASPSHPATVQA